MVAQHQLFNNIEKISLNKKAARNIWPPFYFMLFIVLPQALV